MPSPIRVMIADDHALVRQGFRSLLENLGFLVVGEASDGNQALRLVQALNPDVILMDIAMPYLNGLEAARRLRQEHLQTKVIILSMHATAEYARQALQAGAVGYLLKDSDPVELRLAVEAAVRGDIYLSPQVSKYIVADFAARATAEVDPLSRLTPRQREILQLIAEGHSRKEIAERLSISVKTFDTYRAQLMEQLDIHDVAGLVRFAVSKGLVTPDS